MQKMCQRLLQDWLQQRVCGFGALPWNQLPVFNFRLPDESALQG